MAIARNVINAQLSFWCHCKALDLAFCWFKYVLSGVNSYLTIEIEAIPDPSQKVPKNEKLWMNANFTLGDFAAERDQTMMKWPPRSPDLTPLDFYFWGYIKGKVYVPPFPQTIDELKVRIRAAIQTVSTAVF